MNRETFRKLVLRRDKNKCVICSGVDDELTVHHIIDRKCFPDGGYYVDNGATVCGKCHWKAERGELTPQQIRNAAKIKQIVLPPNLDPTQVYDKWGNVC